MRSRVLLPLALAALPAVASADDAPAAPPPPPAAAAPQGPVTVATEVVSGEGGAQDSLHATVSPFPLWLDDQAPASVKAPPPAGASPTLYGQLPTPGRPTVLAVVRGAGDALTLYADVDGDGAFAGDAETFASVGTESTGPTKKRTGERWSLKNVKIGAALATVSLAENLGAWTGAASAPSKAKGADGKPVPAMRLEFSEKAPDGIAKPPPLLGTVMWATGTFSGDAVVVAAARGTDDVLSLVVAKAGEADLSAAKPITAKGVAMRRDRRRIGTHWFFHGADVLGHATEMLQVASTETAITGTVVPAATRRGTVKVGDADWVLCLVDGDYDGKFSSDDDLWWFGPPADAVRPRRPPTVDYSRMFEASEPMREKGGEAWRLVSVSADGKAVVAPEPKPGDVGEYFHRRTARVNEKRWFRLFEPGLDEFAASQQIDLARPRAAAPAAWHHGLDFAAARKLAAKEGKPLLVDFEADWCPWCKRLDFHTYPDAEVVACLAKFTCVKLNTEFDVAKTFDSMKDVDDKAWGAIPTVGVFDGYGSPLRFSYAHGTGPDDVPQAGNRIVGFLPPPLFVKALDAAYEAWKKTAP